MQLKAIKIEFTELMIIVVVLVLIGIVIAQPGLPDQFYGQVKCPNGAAVVDGTQLDLYDNGTIIKTVYVSNGTYGYSPIILLWDLADNTQIDIYVNNQSIASSNFIQGEITNLDLVSNNSACSPLVVSSPPGGGGSGSGGSGGPPSYTGGPILGVPSSADQFPGQGNGTNGSTQNSPNIQPGEGYKKIIENIPIKIDKFVALNISLFSLIIMAIFSLYSFRKLNQKSKSI